MSIKEETELIAKNENTSKSKLFDIIALDLQMPILDGYEACKNIINKYENSRILQIAPI